MLFCELYKIMLNKITFVGYRASDRPSLDPPLHSLNTKLTCLVQSFIDCLSRMKYCRIQSSSEVVLLYYKLEKQTGLEKNLI